MKQIATKKLTQIAMIAGLYAAITFATFYISFGAVQYRISEALTVLPAFAGSAIPGLTLGCVIANLFGFFIGANPLGLIDAVIGSSATLIAAIITRYISRLGLAKRSKAARYLLCPLPPVLINAVIVGLELTFLFSTFGESGFWAVFAGNAFFVFIGQAVVCYGLGVPLMLALERKELYKRIFKE